jgi:hypothetical protein
VSDIAIAWEESATEDDVEALRGSLGADADEDDPDVPDAASGSQGSALSGSVGAAKRSDTTFSTSSRVSGRIVKHMSSAFDDDDVGFLTLAFPLPCEDPLSSARRASRRPSKCGWRRAAECIVVRLCSLFLVP